MILKSWNFNNNFFFIINFFFLKKKFLELLIIIILNTKLQFYIQNLYFLKLIKNYKFDFFYIKKIKKKKIKFILFILIFILFNPIINFYYTMNYKIYIIINLFLFIFIKYNSKYYKNFKNLLIIFIENLNIYLIGIFYILKLKDINILYNLCGNYIKNLKSINYQNINGLILCGYVISHNIFFYILINS